MDVKLEDVTPDFPGYGLQGPASIDILEAVTGEKFRDLPFNRWRMSKVNDLLVRICRTGVTGEVGYEFHAPTDTGKAYEIWRAIREVGKPFGLREMGWRVQTVGHVETGIATGVVDFLAAWPPHYTMRRFIAQDEVACLEWDLSEHLCSPAELGFGHVIDFEHDYLGRDALLREAEEGGPARRLVGLEWNSEDVAELFAAQLHDDPAPPPPELPKGRFSPLYNKLLKDGEHVGWATSHAYSPTLRRMISLARIRKDLIEPGTDVIILWGSFSDEPKCELRARVVKLPFIPQTRRADLMK